jgi:hypothetical protein
MSFKDLKKAIKDYVSGKRCFTLSEKQQEKLLSEFEQYCQSMLNGEVKNFDVRRVLGEFEWLSNYAKNEPDNKTQFKSFNIKSVAHNLVGGPNMLDDDEPIVLQDIKLTLCHDAETMLKMIGDTCEKSPETAKTHVGRYLAAYREFEQKYRQVYGKLSGEARVCATAARKPVAESYEKGLVAIKSSYETTQDVVLDYVDRRERQIATTQAINDFSKNRN